MIGVGLCDVCALWCVLEFVQCVWCVSVRCGYPGVFMSVVCCMSEVCALWTVCAVCGVHGVSLCKVCTLCRICVVSCVYV